VTSAARDVMSDSLIPDEFSLGKATMATTPAEAPGNPAGHAHIELNQPGADTISVVVAAHTDDRWAEIVKAVTLAQTQSPPPSEVVLVIDHNPGLAMRARAELLGVSTVENEGSRGASAARNTGVENCSGDIVVFLDDDQAPTSSNWIQLLCRHFGDEQVVGVGGGIVPNWPGDRPRWFPGEFDWVIGTSYIGMPEEVSPIRNVWGGNTAIRRSVFLAVGGFRSGFGKIGNVSRPEDTDLCLRVRQAFPSGDWLYDPEAVVSHLVPPERSTRRFFIKRCWQEGRGKAALVRFVGPDGSESERKYATKVLPQGVLREMRIAILQRETAALERSVAIVLGFVVTGAGWLAEMAIGVTRAAR
jgi:GT2 family glycosyltransferase